MSPNVATSSKQTHSGSQSPAESDPAIQWIEVNHRFWNRVKLPEVSPGRFERFVGPCWAPTNPDTKLPTGFIWYQVRQGLWSVKRAK